MSSEVLSTSPIETTQDISGQGKLVVREGQLRVAQVSAAELKNGSSDIEIADISAASDPAPPEKPDTVALMGGTVECTKWILSYVASANQYCRTENDVYNKIKKQFSVFHDKSDVLNDLRNLVSEIPLMESEDEGIDKVYRTTNNVRYLMDSCVTLHFFMKGSGNVEKILKEKHQEWYEDESWDALGLPYDCFQKIMKGKLHKAMSGAIAGKYSSWPGAKEFSQRHTFGAPDYKIKLSDLYRIMKKDFTAPHDIIKHMKMDQVLEYCVSTIPGLQIVEEKDEKTVVTDSDVLDLVGKIRHLQVSGVKNIAREFSSFHPGCTDWTSYHMTYQKLNQFFKNILNPNRRSSKVQAQEEERKAISSAVLDSSHKKKHNYRAIGVNTTLEKRRPRSEEPERHVNYNEGGRSRSNSVAERDENTVVYLNTDKKSIVNVIGLPGTGKTTTLATMLGRVHNKTCPSTVLVISSNCCTTNKLLEYTRGTVLRACPSVDGTTKKCEEKERREYGCCNKTSEERGEVERRSSETFIVHEEFEKVDLEKPGSPDAIEELVLKPESPELVKTNGEEEKPYSPTESVDTAPEIDGLSLEDGEIREIEAKLGQAAKIPEAPKKEVAEVTAKEEGDMKIEDEFNKIELPWMVYGKIGEVLNSESVGRITVLHFPDHESMEAEVICEAMEGFAALPANLPKYLIIDDNEALSHPCNSNTLDNLVEQHRHNNMSIWVATTSPAHLPVNMMDFSHLTILHQYTSKNWYTDLSDHLPLTSVTFHHCQGLTPGQCVMVAPGANMQNAVHSSSYCYPCTIIPPKPIK